MPDSPPAQQQTPPGDTAAMTPEPRDEMRGYRGRDLLAGTVALVTGGDSGIGRAVCVAFAKEGADVALAHLDEDTDAEHTARLVRDEGRRCLTLPGDLGDAGHCAEVVRRTVDELGRLDTVVNNIATQDPVDDLTDIDDDAWLRTFEVNIHSYFRVTKAALAHLPDGGAIVNTGSINGLRGNKSLIDYSATKGAVQSLTSSLAQSLTPRGIRVNCVAPGPVWTPLIPATMPEEKVEGFGEQTPMGRPASPDEIAPSFVFFAAPRLSSYYTGEVLAPVGGETLPG
ncbi:Enoyl-[acyl-carrier-protein] reductase [NADPH] [Pseudonocardia sp. Ae406_Ps2]|nr:Enoyl-[acyl-carrier-protein] reductase [NADPH] [Pseudonocardia sp. Ae406_Ps2]OLM06217.1 Enoyl-[acyl-carrier-protein] reductase [NADPH] [Pseudonocardia sp. Ae331_Ps2]OLM12954.1 Enoyl-[acyl-carrier-protein] reductase [NADPH] [Pseudonocardia sp. Ae505_Ps2]OLM23574.1 Enoyl-[acyl-carrier-protein] reductase [NADPH] [Pseudonocardia sp. Ae706_Ps2]OLM32613.1 Enoyl-[acyl-carrier-protein] reductase [NADPH] [Pseudonocardia sp. Ae717_Ps2]